MAVFVLGAGATRGASFVDPKKNPCLPPLDGDFFTQLQKVANAKHRDLVANVVADVVELFGINFRLTLETVFTTLEHTIRMIETTGETRDFKRDALKKKRDRLLQAIAAVMEEALTEGRDASKCLHHEAFVKLLMPSDRIISFNYDCLIDHSLQEHGDNKWNPRYGYGFALGSHGTSLTGDTYWAPQKPAEKKNTVRLYKLHGSLHFDVRSSRVKLKERPYTKQSGDVHFTVIPPEWNKHYDEGVFRRLWKEAGTEIHRSTTLVLIGYSLPVSDLHSTALFRISVKKDALKSLVIVNPDREARRRSRDVLRRGLSDTTKILVFDGFHEFVAAARDLWD